VVKKLERQEAWAVSAFGVASPPVVRYSFAKINGAHRGLDGKGRFMDLARILAYVTGTVDQVLLARNEYLAAENRILKAQLQGRLKLSDAERAALGEIGHRLGRKVLAEVATVARPDTILAWYRKQSSGKRQRPVVPSQYGPPPRGSCAMSREAGRALALLPSRSGVRWQASPR
jgi:hypothetical protein